MKPRFFLNSAGRLPLPGRACPFSLARETPPPGPESARTLPKRNARRNAGNRLIFLTFVASCGEIPRLRRPRFQATARRARRLNQMSIAAAVMTTGNTTSFTVAQPATARILPDEKEPTAIEPKTRKSLNDWT
jgi:hypothetical protein